MTELEALRARTLSAPGLLLGDLVICRRGPLDHEFHARVVGRTIGPDPRYDVETEDGVLVRNLQIVRLGGNND